MAQLVLEPEIRLGSSVSALCSLTKLRNGWNVPTGWSLPVNKRDTQGEGAHLDTSEYSNRKFAIYISRLGPPNQTNARCYGDTYISSWWETRGQEHVKKLKTPLFEGIENVSRPLENRLWCKCERFVLHPLIRS